MDRIGIATGTESSELNGRDADTQKRLPGVRISLTGFDSSFGEYELKRALTKHFSSCGDIIKFYIGRDFFHTLGRVAFMEILGEDAREKALELDGSDVGGWNVTVESLPFQGPDISYYSGSAFARRAASIRRHRSITVAVSGYDTSLPVDDIERALRCHFSSCGEITYISFDKTGRIDRHALIYIMGEGSTEKALKLNGSDAGGWKVAVEALAPPICAKDVMLKTRCFGICATGYDTGLPEDDIKTALSKHFRPCGEVMDIFITRNHGSSAVDSKALIYIRGEDAGDKAMELSGSDMGGCKLVTKVDSVPDEYYCYLPHNIGRTHTQDPYTKKAKMTTE